MDAIGEALLQRRPHRRLRALASVAMAALLVLGGNGAPVAALPILNQPALLLTRVIRTTPFAGSTTSMGDGEGSAYVPADDSLWLVEDQSDRCSRSTAPRAPSSG